MVSAIRTLFYGLALCATGWWVNRTKTDAIVQANRMREIFAPDESSKSACEWKSRLQAMDENYPAHALASFADSEESLTCMPYVEYAHEMYESMVVAAKPFVEQSEMLQSTLRTFGTLADMIQEQTAHTFTRMSHAVEGSFKMVHIVLGETLFRSELEKRLPKGIYQSKLFQWALNKGCNFLVDLEMKMYMRYMKKRDMSAAMNNKSNNWKISGKQVLSSYFKAQLRKENAFSQSMKHEVIRFFVFADEAKVASVDAACIGMFLFGAVLLVIHSPFAQARPVFTLAIRLMVIFLTGCVYLMDQGAAYAADALFHWFLYCLGSLATGVIFLRYFFICLPPPNHREEPPLRGILLLMLPPVFLLFIRGCVLAIQGIRATDNEGYADIGLICILLCMVGDYTRFGEELAAARNTFGVLFGQRRD